MPEYNCTALAAANKAALAAQKAALAAQKAALAAEKVADEVKHVYVLSVDSLPQSYFNTKTEAVEEMRKQAREMCLIPNLFETHRRFVFHKSEDEIDVVQHLVNVLISYDYIVRSFKIFRVVKNM
jgi:hypothetical protein